MYSEDFDKHSSLIIGSSDLPKLIFKTNPEPHRLISIHHFKRHSLFGGDYCDLRYPGFRCATPGAIIWRSFRAEKRLYIKFPLYWGIVKDYLSGNAVKENPIEPCKGEQIVAPSVSLGCVSQPPRSAEESAGISTPIRVEAVL